MNSVEKLIAFGYFPSDIPSEFYTEELAKAMSKIDLTKLDKKAKKRWTKSVCFSVPKSDNFRRTLSIPSPIHQIQLSNLIVESWDELNDFFALSTVSMTTPAISNDTDKSFEFKNDISEKMDIRINNLYNKNYILQTDISRYFPTIYSHVIPWALHSKAHAKKNITNDGMLGNKIDKLVQCMQDGQTFGIPIGPQTSRIISEIIGTAIDKDFSESMGEIIPGFRFTDDMEYYFDTEEAAKNALFKLHNVVREYQLELNDEKTKIIKSPIEFEPEWSTYFTRFNFRESKNAQCFDIKAYFSKAFSFKHETGDKGVLKYALKRMRNLKVSEENWDVYESLLLHTAFSDSQTMPIVLEIILYYSAQKYKMNRDKYR